TCRPPTREGFYRDAAPTSSWRKVKVRHEGRFLVGGIAIARSGYTGLLVGARVGRELRYLGCVEWGVRRGVIDALAQGARLRDDSPFVDLRQWRDVTWLEPRLIVEVTLRWSQIDLATGRIQIDQTKNDGGRIAYIPTTSLSLLLEQRGRIEKLQRETN